MSQILIFLEKIKNHADLMSYGCFFYYNVHVPKVRVCLQRVCPSGRLEWPPLDSNVAFFRRDSHFSTSHVFESNKMSQILIFLEKIKNHADLMSYGFFFFILTYMSLELGCVYSVSAPPERLEWPPLDSNVAFFRRGSHSSTCWFDELQTYNSKFLFERCYSTTCWNCLFCD